MWRMKCSLREHARSSNAVKGDLSSHYYVLRLNQISYKSVGRLGKAKDLVYTNVPACVTTFTMHVHFEWGQS